MRKENLTVIATIIAVIAFSLFTFEPTTVEAGNNISPSATPSPRKKRPKTIQSPKPIQSPNLKTKNRKRQTIEVENDETHRTRKPTAKIKPQKPNSFQEVSGIGMEVTLRRRRSNQTQAQYNPKELQINNSVKTKSSKNKAPKRRN